MADATAPSGENEEIDRIMKEIEDLEKKMDTAASEVEAEQPRQQAASQPEVAAAEESDSEESSTEPAFSEKAADKVVPIRASASAESMVETDAVPVSDEPLMRSSSSVGDGGLSLKVGGCTEVSLEFSRAGMSVTLTCTDDGLSITTDQGAEFRIPFKRAA